MFKLEIFFYIYKLTTNIKTHHLSSPPPASGVPPSGVGPVDSLLESSAVEIVRRERVVRVVILAPRVRLHQRCVTTLSYTFVVKYIKKVVLL